MQTIATSFAPAKASEPAFEHQDDEGSAFQVRSGAMGSLRIARLRWESSSLLQRMSEQLQWFLTSQTVPSSQQRRPMRLHLGHEAVSEQHDL